MTSIPADPGLVLGNVIEPYRINQLMAIADLQKPIDLATDRLNNLTTSNYKIQLIYQQMVNFKVDMVSLVKIQAEMVAMKADMADAAIDLGEQVMVAEKAIRELKEKQAQTKISKQVESPMNYELSAVKQFPLSYDSLKFDVQFFQVQKSEDSSAAFASSVSSHVAGSFSSWFTPSVTAEASASAHSTAMTSSTTNMLDGTIVITAYCTHKQIDVMAPFVMDAQKAVRAWNYCNPKDRLKSNAASMWKAALKEEEEEEGKSKSSLQILSGVAKSSTFVGYVHVLKTEKTEQSQMTASVASAVKTTMEYNMGLAAMSGSFSASAEASSTVNSLLSTANLTTNCTLQCMGVIPSIVSNTIETAVQNMKPDPTEVMRQLGAIADAGSTDVNAGMKTEAGNATTGAQFIELNNSYITNSVQALGEETRISNKVIDTNSMMTAFEDYVNKAIEGNCGVPTAYFIKDLHKADIAKCYIRRYYPNGATNQKDAMAGELGTTPEEGGAAN